jgi:uncharacterized protein (DUF433 family)
MLVSRNALAFICLFPVKFESGRQGRSQCAQSGCGGAGFVALEVLGYHSACDRDLNESGKSMTHARISNDPATMMGKPCIKGTRITVELILRKLGAGRSFADLLEAYPQLTEDDLRAALAFAADYMQHETVLAAE